MTGPKRVAIAMAALVAVLSVAPPNAAAMQEGLFSFLLLEADYAREGRSARWEGQGWVGADYHKLWLKTEGERVDGELDEADAQVLYSRFIADFWDVQVGVRRAVKPEGVTYAVVGVQGLAPYWFETDLAAFLDDRGDLSARADLSYELLFTQRLIAQLSLNGDYVFETDRRRGIGWGAEIEAGIRLRYEIIREVAPYLEFTSVTRTGDAADLVVNEGRAARDRAVRVGLRLWY